MHIQVFGSQFSDPRSFVSGISFLYAVDYDYINICEPDSLVRTFFNRHNKKVLLEGVVPPLFRPRDSLNRMINEQAKLLYLLPDDIDWGPRAIKEHSVFMKVLKHKNLNNCVTYVFNSWHGSTCPRPEKNACFYEQKLATKVFHSTCFGKHPDEKARSGFELLMEYLGR